MLVFPVKLREKKREFFEIQTLKYIDNTMFFVGPIVKSCNILYYSEGLHVKLYIVNISAYG